MENNVYVVLTALFMVDTATFMEITMTLFVVEREASFAQNSFSVRICADKFLLTKLF